VEAAPRSMEASGRAEVAAAAARRRAQPSGWWGMVLLVATEATLFACLIATYFYLRFNASEWPLGGIEPPSVVLPLAFTAGLLAATAPISLSVREAKRGDARRAWWLLAAAAAIQATYLGLQIHLFVSDMNSFSPHEKAYSSIYFTLLGLHHAHIAVGLALDAWLLWKLARGITNYRLIGLRAVALYWYLVNVAAVAVVLTQLSPSL